MSIGAHSADWAHSRPFECAKDAWWLQGLWVIQAPGEAEATCAALNRGGYVDACATVDSDVLLFGAETAFHTLRPLVTLSLPNPPHYCNSCLALLLLSSSASVDKKKAK